MIARRIACEDDDVRIQGRDLLERIDDVAIVDTIADGNVTELYQPAPDKV